MQTRIRENERIAELKGQIARLKSSSFDLEDEDIEIDFEKLAALKELQVNNLMDRIKHILESRAQREVLAAEREMMRTKTLLEESKHRAQESQPSQSDLPKDEEEAEEEKQRARMKGLTRIAATQDNISSLRRTRSALASEAGHIRRAIESGSSNYIKTGRIPSHISIRDKTVHIGNELILSVQSGYGNPNDFRNKQLGRVSLAISGVDAAINHSISSMYRESAKLQESQLVQYRQSSEEEQENETVGVDEEL